MIKLMSQLNDLQNAVTLFHEVIDPSNEMMVSAVNTVQENLEWLNSHVATIADTATLNWVIKYGISDMRACLTPIQGYVEMLNIGAFGELTAPQQACISRVVQCVEHIVDTTNSSFSQAQETYQGESAAPTVILLPEDALAPVWPILRFDLAPSQINISCRHGQNPIVYHRVHTTEMLIDFIQTLVNPIIRNTLQSDLRIRPIFHIVAQPIQEAFVVSLCIQQLIMLPDLWAQMQDRPSVEHLYELGGTIESLTWDEGYGQGVSVRLPWAKECL